MKWDDGQRPYPSSAPTMPDPSIWSCCGGRAAYGHIRRRHIENRVWAVVIFTPMVAFIVFLLWQIVASS